MGHESLDEVLQLPHVAWPPVVHQDLHRRVGDPLDRLAESCLVPLQEEAYQVREVLDSLAQRREPEGDDVDAVVQIFAELPSLTALSSSLLVATTRWKSVLTTLAPPTRSISPS